MNDSVAPGQERTRAVAAVFDRVAASYDQVGIAWFTPIAKGLVSHLNPLPGERILDAGCGRGAVLLPLAEAVGPTGHVTGIDVAKGMIDALRADVTAHGLTQVDLAVMDATAPDLTPGSFHAIASSLVLFFLPDPITALRSWHELLRPGGRVAISTFGPRDEIVRAVDDVFAPFLPPQLLDARTSGASGPFASDQGVEHLFQEAGFHDVRTTSRMFTAVFRDAGQWREWSWSHGQRAMWEAVPAERHDEVLARATELLRPARNAAGQIALSQSVRYTLGSA